MIQRNNIKRRFKTCISAMLLQSYINKWRISQLTKLDYLYITYALTRLLEISKNDFVEYKKQITPNYSHVHLRACDDTSPYNCSSTMIGSKITKWYCILNFCSDCPITNATFLESSEQLNCFFPAFLHKIKFRIFQNICKCSIHVLSLFKNNNMCE